MTDQTEAAARGEELKRALLAIRDLRRQVQAVEGRAREPIAIIGMSCRLPGGADTPERYWELLRAATDATSDVPPDRWDIDSLYDPDPDAPGRVYTRRGGFLREPIDLFDAGFFGISPREAEAMDPVQRLLLELSWEALERAGIAPLSLDGTGTGVFVGVSGSDYDTLQHQSASLDAIHTYRGTGTAACVAGGRISHVLGLQGPNISVDTACSSSLSAIVLAVESLRAGNCRVALAGGAHLMLAPESTVYLCRMRALSPDGRCRTFDAAADGYARGEGGGMFVLKRLSDARADADRVLATIRGAAINHDGHSSGLTVPNPVAQRAVIQAALRSGSLDPLEVDYIEAHGTATPLGDPIEVRAAAEVLCHNRPADRPLLIGSVKTNFGHLEAASGVAGLMKLVLALQHREIPPHLHCAKPTPHIDWSRTPVRVTTAATPWQPEGRAPIGGVSAFGFSGTNAHVIVEAAPETAEPEAPRHPAELVTLSARSRDALRALAARYAGQLRDADAEVLAQVAVTSVAGRSPLPFRAAVVGDGAQDVVAALDELAAGGGSIEHVRGAPAGHLAFLFTGQGSQYPGMARELFQTSATARDVLEHCAGILRPHLDRPLLELLLEEEDANILQRTEYAQPALFAVEYALAALWRSWGVKPAFVVGHSLGEYVAATVAGVMALEDALPLVALRGRLMQGLPEGGAMAAVLASETVVRSALSAEPEVSVAALNGPENTVISGPGEALSKILRQLEANGVQSKPLHVSHAFHSALMEPILDAFQEAVSKMSLEAPRIPLVSNLTGELLTAAEAVDPVRWRRHLREPVRFAPSLTTLQRLGVRRFLEVGPHPALCAIGAAAVPDADMHWLPSMRRGLSGWRQMLETAGQLWRRGVELDTAGFAKEHGASRTVAPTYPFERSRFWYTDALVERPGGRSAAAGGILPAEAGAAETGHPFLGQPIRSPAIEGWVFQTMLHPDRPGYLRDHQVQGAVVVPAAVFIEMMASGVQEALQWQGYGLEQLAIEAPLVLMEETGTLCQVVVGAPVEGKVEVRVVSDGPGRRWITHARAEARERTALAAVAAAADPALLQRDATRQMQADELYGRLETRGIAYGPAFRGVETVWAGDSTVLGRVRLPADAADGNSGTYGVHPCLMDFTFQVLEGLSGDPDPEQVYLPVGVERIQRYGTVPASAWVLARRREQNGDADVLVADLAILGESGEVMVELKGFRARRVRGTVAARASDALVYEMAFEPVELPALVDAEVAGRWLVLDNSAPQGEELLAAMSARGARFLKVRQAGRTEFPIQHAAADAGDVLTLEAREDSTSWSALEQAIGGEPLLGVLHLCSLYEGAGKASDGAGRLEQLLDQTAIVPALLRIAAVRNAPRGLRILTRGAVSHGPAGAPGGEGGAALWGLLRVVQAEHPEIACRAVDVNPGAGAGIDTLMAAMFSGIDEDRLVLRDGVPFAPRLRTVLEDSSSTPGELELPAGESYAIEITERGALDALRYRPARRHAPEPGEVEVRVRATGLNFRDVLNVLGMYPGASGPPGVEFAGVVTRVGDAVTRFRVGDEVLGIGEGAFAAYVTGPEAALARMPRTLSATEAATIPLAFLTAEWALNDLARLEPGERVLIHAAAGGVGQAAVQIALARGAEVFATAGSEGKRDWLRSQGVRHVFDSRSETFADGVREATDGEGVDVVLNSLTGVLLQRTLELLRPGGRFVEIGKAEILDPADVEARHQGIRYLWFDLGAILLEEPDTFRALFERVLDRVERRELAPLPTRIYPAEQAVDAFRYMAQARHIGKIVVSARQVEDPSRGRIHGAGAYLVTGGAGAVGREVAAWLVREGAGTVLLNGRSSATPEVRAWMNELARGGTSRIDWVQGDVTSPEVAERLVAAAGKEEHALKGIFHAAGVLDDGLLLDQTRERFRGVMAPKVAGAWNLHLVTRDLELDYFVLFSSVASVLGGPGQGSYAASNAFLDALAEMRSREGLPALSVQWGAWSGAGMAARLDARQRKALEAQGVRPLAPHRAVEVLERLLTGRRSVAMVTDVDWTRVATAARRMPPLLRALVMPRASAAGGNGKLAIADHSEVPSLEGLSSGDRRAVLLSYLCATLAAVLGIRGRPVDEDAEITHLGFDSLMAVQLRNRIETELGALVPVGEMLQAATPADIAEALDLRLATTPQTVMGTASSAPAWTEGEI